MFRPERSAWVRSCGGTVTPSATSISGRLPHAVVARAARRRRRGRRGDRDAGGARRTGDRHLRRIRRRAGGAAHARTARRSPRPRAAFATRARPRSTWPGRSIACWPGPTATTSPKREAIHEEQRDVDARIGECGHRSFPDGGNVLTHCNTGPLATGGDGTALGAFVAAHRAGKQLHVYADETRPLLQGARLTMFELRAAGVPATLIVDSAAAITMRAQGRRPAVDRRRRPHRAQRRHRQQDRHLRRRDRRRPSRHPVLRRRAALDVRLRARRRRSRSRSRSARPDEVRSSTSDVRCTTRPSTSRPATLIAGIVTEYGVLRPPYEEAIADLETDRAPGCVLSGARSEQRSLRR